MQFQTSHISIIRSIRQVSLVRDWFRARGGAVLPTIASFEPNERAGDVLDLMLCEVSGDGEHGDIRCLQAGERVGVMFDAALAGRSLRECFDPVMAGAALPIWNACLAARLPVYTIIPVVDAEGCPVTLEQVLLPYGKSGETPEFIVASIHACSTEGRFSPKALMRAHDRAPAHWAVAIDPAAVAVSRPVQGEPGTGAVEQIVMDVI